MWPLKKKYKHEVFLSHAVEDKAAIANELCVRLKGKGIEVWYSGDELAGGIDLQRAIEEAIAESRFGVVIFTKAFIAKQWTLKELALLEQKERGNKEVILSVLHEMTMAEFAVFSPHHASKFCLQTSRGLDFVVKQIFNKVLEERARIKKAEKRWVIGLTFFILSFLIVTSVIAFQIYNHKPSDPQIENSINERIESCSNSIESKYLRQLRANHSSIRQAQIDSIWQAYDEIKSYYRNEYEFNNCLLTLSGRKRIETLLGKDMVEMSHQPGYGLDSLNAYRSDITLMDGWRHAGFCLVNNRPVQFSWTAHRQESGYVVVVSYYNFIRYINVSLSMPPSLAGTKRHEMTIAGFSPREMYYFEEDADGGWYLKSIESSGN